MTGGRRRLHTAFLVVTGLIGWTALIWVARDLRVPAVGELEVALLFLGVVAGARALTFPLPGGSEVSLDTAIFIAAAACLGPALTSVGVAWVLAVDGLRRERLPYALYLGGVAGALLAGWSQVFGVGSGDRDVWLVPALGGASLISHYGVQALQEWLGGIPWRQALKRNALSVVAEATLLPLASAIVLIWEPHRPIPFALLGGTYLLVNFGFKRLAELASDLRLRVAELETLNRTAHALGTSLETPALLAALLRETARALPLAERIDAVVELDGELVLCRMQGGGLALSPAGARQRLALQEHKPRLI